MTWFWWFLFVCNLVVPVAMIGAGRMMWKHCPQKINGVVGYRTRRSMRNMDTWRFAHDYCGRLWWKLGWWMLLASVLVQLPFFNSGERAVSWAGGVICGVQYAIMIGTVFLVERALGRTFFEDGRRRV